PPLHSPHTHPPPPPLSPLSLHDALPILTRLNLGSVTINPDVTSDSITRSTVHDIAIVGGATGAGNHVIDQDTITGSVSLVGMVGDRKSTRLNSSHLGISYAVFCLKKKKK